MVKYSQMVYNKHINCKRRKGMDELEKELIRKRAELELIKNSAERKLKNVQEGKIHVSKRKKTYQYYLKTKDDNGNGQYIKKSNLKLVETLVQKEYENKILKAVDGLQKDIEKLINRYNSQILSDIYLKLPNGKKELVRPYVLPPDEYALKWEEEQAKLKDLLNKKGHNVEDIRYLHDLGIVTEKGEYVRSKSEKILADKFYMMNVPYVYEMPLNLKGYGYIKPDFKVLNPYNKKEYLWEHMGMLGEDEYATGAIKKIETYSGNGYFEGDNLILTFETKEAPLNMKHVERIIKKYLVN